jgi:hypothetical protein
MLSTRLERDDEEQYRRSEKECLRLREWIVHSARQTARRAVVHAAWMSAGEDVTDTPSVEAGWALAMARRRRRSGAVLVSLYLPLSILRACAYVWVTWMIVIEAAVASCVHGLKERESNGRWRSITCMWWWRRLIREGWRVGCWPVQLPGQGNRRNI